jgi:hypothetical protein
MSFPKATAESRMIIVDTRVDDTNDNTFTIVFQLLMYTVYLSEVVGRDGFGERTVFMDRLGCEMRTLDGANGVHAGNMVVVKQGLEFVVITGSSDRRGSRVIQVKGEARKQVMRKLFVDLDVFVKGAG